nr:hypothetical protein [Anaerolineae bacterium]
MSNRTKWQYCQIEVGSNSVGMLKQFFPDRIPVETDLHQGWPAMIGKLGDQGWEMVGVFPNEGGRGRSPLTYVFKRVVSGTPNPMPVIPQPTLPPSAPPIPPQPTYGSTPLGTPDDEDDQGPVTDFEPLDFS